MHDLRGNIAIVEGGVEIDFPVARVYWLYDVPEGASRAGHAHAELEQLLVATSGSFDVLLDDGRERQRVRLDRPDQGLVLPRLVWRELDGFSRGATCLVLASLPYDEDDYYRDYDEFLRAASGA